MRCTETTALVRMFRDESGWYEQREALLRAKCIRGQQRVIIATGVTL